MNKSLKSALFIVGLLLIIAAAYLVYKNFHKTSAQPLPPADNGNEQAKIDLIRIQTPRPNEVVQSPLTITGQARGTWFFEGSFPVVLTDWDGLIIAQGTATAKGDWMTTEFVPFTATLIFTVDKDVYSNKGTLILRKDNPSGLPQNDDALEIPVVFVTNK
ncbi:MAG: hypothetical protein NT034_02455 [Candidatus Magasanikbacteria bacterium]|nr:hypothetical protein [Candidatus Magasanikbacteria bacterium]